MIDKINLVRSLTLFRSVHVAGDIWSRPGQGGRARADAEGSPTFTRLGPQQTLNLFKVFHQN